MSGSESTGAADSPDASFRVEVLEEATSPKRFLFFSKPLSSELAGGGFRTSRCRINLDWPFLGKMRTRNQNLMILQKNSRRKDISETTYNTRKHRIAVNTFE
jgi:hypothetical protein